MIRQKEKKRVRRSKAEVELVRALSHFSGVDAKGMMCRKVKDLTKDRFYGI